MTKHFPPPDEAPASPQPPPDAGGHKPQDPDKSHYRKILIAGGIVLAAFLLIFAGVQIGSDSSSSSSSDSSTSSRTAEQCFATVSTAMDRSLAAFYGAESAYSSTYGSSYYPGYYPYQVDTSSTERSSLVSTYGEGSGEVRAWDAALYEVQRWHHSGTYSYNTMIDSGASQITSACQASYS